MKFPPPVTKVGLRTMGLGRGFGCGMMRLGLGVPFGLIGVNAGLSELGVSLANNGWGGMALFLFFVRERVIRVSVIRSIICLLNFIF